MWWLILACIPTAANTQSDSRNYNILRNAVIVKSDAYSSLIHVRNRSLLPELGDVWIIGDAMTYPILWETFSFEEEEEEEGSYSIRKLLPNTSYIIRNVRHQNDNDALDLKIQTCPETPPKVQFLRLNEAGLGWLDIRWKQPKEECSSIIVYKVSYSYTTSKTGYITKTILFFVPKKEFLYFTHAKLTHPCDTWPDEFCVLLTENIYPGINYEVQVQTGRYTFSSNASQVSEPESISVTTNVSNFGPVDAVQCPTREKAFRSLFKDETACPNTATNIPTWIIIVTSVFIATNIGIIITFVIRRFMKKGKKNSKGPHTPNLTNNSGLSNLSELYDDPKT